MLLLIRELVLCQAATAASEYSKPFQSTKGIPAEVNDVFFYIFATAVVLFFIWLKFNKNR